MQAISHAAGTVGYAIEIRDERTLLLDLVSSHTVQLQRLLVAPSSVLSFQSDKIGITPLVGCSFMYFT